MTRGCPADSRAQAAPAAPVPHPRSSIATFVGTRASSARTIAFASRKKARYLIDYVRASGVPEERLERVKYPAGLDLGGMSAAEIALSVLAEIVQRRYGKAAAMKAAAPSAAEPVSLGRRNASTPSRTAFPVDPVCGMPVDPATARHTLVEGDRTIYFCCPHCKAAYVRRQAESTA